MKVSREKAQEQLTIYRNRINRGDYPTINLPPGLWKRGEHQFTSANWEIRAIDLPDWYFNSPHHIKLLLQGRQIPREYRVLSLLRDKMVVMSNTPAEILDHEPFINQAKGHVFIAGLGLGMCVAALLDKPEVKSITVVEIDQDVINISGPFYQEHPKVEIICTDIHNFIPDQSFDTVWLDIWDDISASNLPEIEHLENKFHTGDNWVGCWSKAEMINTIAGGVDFNFY